MLYKHLWIDIGVCALSGTSAHCDVGYRVLLLKINRCDDVLIEKPELVTWRFVNCVVHNDVLNVYFWLKYKRKISLKELNRVLFSVTYPLKQKRTQISCYIHMQWNLCVYPCVVHESDYIITTLYFTWAFAVWVTTNTASASNTIWQTQISFSTSPTLKLTGIWYWNREHNKTAYQ